MSKSPLVALAVPGAAAAAAAPQAQPVQPAPQPTLARVVILSVRAVSVEPEDLRPEGPAEIT